MTTQAGHDELVAAIAQQVRSLALVTEHIAQTFAAEQGLHPTDFRALSLIFEAERAGSPLTARALARALSLSPGAVTYSVDRLTASEHVWRQKDERDGRRVVLRIAPDGREVAAGFFAPLGRAQAAALADYTDAELAVCSRFLTDLIGAFNQAELRR